MDPVMWAKAKGPAYIGLQIGAAMCVVLLLAVTVLRINNASYDPVVDPAFIAAAGAILGYAGMKFDKSGSGQNSA